MGRLQPSCCLHPQTVPALSTCAAFHKRPAQRLSPGATAGVRFVRSEPAGARSAIPRPWCGRTTVFKIALGGVAALALVATIAISRGSSPVGAASRISPRSKRHDDHPNVANLIGYSYRKLGDYKLSQVWYERALKADPNHVDRRSCKVGRGVNCRWYGAKDLRSGNMGG